MALQSTQRCVPDATPAPGRASLPTPSSEGKETEAGEAGGL